MNRIFTLACGLAMTAVPFTCVSAAVRAPKTAAKTEQKADHACCHGHVAQPEQSTIQVVDARAVNPADSMINALIAQMTLDEKIGQIHQLSGGGGATADMLGMVRAGMVGSLLNEVDPVAINKLQRAAVEESRLHIPLVFARDVIHGFRTIFPIPLGQGASWNPAIAERGARIAAEEGAASGVRWTFSPMLDIARDPRWGRIAEGYGEDPLLTAEMGAATIRGYQGTDLSQPNTMAACAKHFCGYGAVEGGKDYNTTWIPENLLRDVYFPPFERAVQEGAATFMCSFNDINGMPSSANKWMLRDVLRGEWGWDGCLVSDWNSIGELQAHGVAADLREAAKKGAEAGVDVDMQAYAYANHLKDLVEKGEVSMATVDELVRNTLRLKQRLGLFENPYVEIVPESERYCQPASLAAAQQAVEESAILLQNNAPKGQNAPMLPLSPSKNGKKLKVAVVGPMAHAPHDQDGTWVFDHDKSNSVTPLDALRARGDIEVIYAPGLDYSRDRSDKGFKAALKAAKKADVVLYFAGEEAVLSGEAHCRTDLTTPGAQKELVAYLRKAGKPVATIVQAGRPLVLDAERANSDAILYLFHGGTMTGPGLSRLIFGEANPSGHTPLSFPKASAQTPIYYNHHNSGRPAQGITYIDDIPLEAGQTSTGCTSFYLDCGDGPAYPFGYGLSYTDFEFGAPRLSATTMGKDGEITVACTVTNTGSRAGATVAQMYIHDKAAQLAQPVKSLKGFEKIMLQPGESKDVKFTLKAKDLGYHLLDGKYVVEPGAFTLWVSPDSSASASQGVSFEIEN